MTEKRLRELLACVDEERKQLSIECIALNKRLNTEIDYGNQLFNTLRNRILPTLETALEKAKKEYSRAANEYARKICPS